MYSDRRDFMLREELMRIERGMTVIDKSDQVMGDVEMVFYSDENPDKLGPETITASKRPSTTPNWVNAFIESFRIDNDLPEPLKQRLHREGFVRVQKSGFFGNKTYFVPMSSIHNVVDDTVMLNVAIDDVKNLG